MSGEPRRRSRRPPAQHPDRWPGLCFGAKEKRGPEILGATPTRAEEISIKDLTRGRGACENVYLFFFLPLTPSAWVCSSVTSAATALFSSAVAAVSAALASSYFFFCSSVSFMAAMAPCCGFFPFL